jgi:predicted nucleotidyltransferase
MPEIPASRGRTGHALVDATMIREAAALLAAASQPSRVVLFGSYARGDAREGSDVDFLVIEPVVRDRHAEMVRLRDVLRPLRIPVDVLVVSEAAYEQWSGVPGTVAHAAASEGRDVGS